MIGRRTRVLSEDGSVLLQWLHSEQQLLTIWNRFSDGRVTQYTVFVVEFSTLIPLDHGILSNYTAAVSLLLLPRRRLLLPQMTATAAANGPPQLSITTASPEIGSQRDPIRI